MAKNTANGWVSLWKHEQPLLQPLAKLKHLTLAFNEATKCGQKAENRYRNDNFLIVVDGQYIRVLSIKEKAYRLLKQIADSKGMGLKELIEAELCLTFQARSGGNIYRGRAGKGVDNAKEWYNITYPTSIMNVLSRP